MFRRLLRQANISTVRSFSTSSSLLNSSEAAFQVSTLDNGLRVATEYIPGETATVGVFVDAGSRYETSQNNGVAHFLEHMAFKGTTKRSQKQMEVEVENMGAHLNAYTSREQTVYYAKVMKNDVGRGVDLLSDILLNSTFEKNALERERSVILREMEEVESNMEEVVFDRLHETAYQGTPLGYTILGPVENINSIQQDDLRKYIDTYYTGGKMVLAAAGAINHKQVVEFANKYFSKVQATSSSAFELEACPFTGSDIRVINYDLPVAHVAVAVQSPGWVHEDSIPLMVMQSMIGSYDRNAGAAKYASSKLAQEVHEWGLAKSFMSFNSSYKDTGLFGCYGVFDGDFEHHLDDLVYAIENSWVRIAYNATPGEVERAKTQLKTQLLTGLDGTTATCEEIGRQMIVYGRRITPQELLERVDRVTVADVKRAAQTYIYDQDVAAAFIGPVQYAPDYHRLRKWTHWYRV